METNKIGDEPERMKEQLIIKMVDRIQTERARLVRIHNEI